MRGSGPSVADAGVELPKGPTRACEIRIGIAFRHTHILVSLNEWA